MTCCSFTSQLALQTVLQHLSCPVDIVSGVSYVSTGAAMTHFTLVHYPGTYRSARMENMIQNSAKRGSSHDYLAGDPQLGHVFINDPRL